MGWSHIAAIFTKGLDISHVAWSVLVVLAKLSDERSESWPSIPYVAEKAKLSTRSVNNGIRELKAAGLVDIKSGRGNRHVNHYRLTDRVVNLSTNVHEVHVSNVHEVHVSEGERCTRCTLKTHEVHVKGARGAHGSKREDTKEELVSRYVPDPTAAGSTEAAEKCSSSKGDGAQSTPPAAAGYERDELLSTRKAYEALLRTEGWKPKSRKDAEWAAWCCYQLGASGDEAKAFARYNNIRKWSAAEAPASVRQLAKEWVKAWRRREPDAWIAEVARRKTGVK